MTTCTKSLQVGIGLLVSALALVVLASGCENEVCQEAADKLETCDYTDNPLYRELECTGEWECGAECTLDACTCEDLRNFGLASDECTDCFRACEADS